MLSGGRAVAWVVFTPFGGGGKDCSFERAQRKLAFLTVGSRCPARTDAG